MKKTYEATGFERAACSSWESWDCIDGNIYQFYEADLNECLACKSGMKEAPLLEIDLKGCKLKIYDLHGEVLFSTEVKMVFSE